MDDGEFGHGGERGPAALPSLDLSIGRAYDMCWTACRSGRVRPRPNRWTRAVLPAGRTAG